MTSKLDVDVLDAAAELDVEKLQVFRMQNKAESQTETLQLTLQVSELLFVSAFSFVAWHIFDWHTSTKIAGIIRATSFIVLTTSLFSSKK